jgi:hypothetical protein
MHIRTMAFLACAALALSAQATDTQSTAMSGECQGMIKHHWNAMHVVVGSGTLQTKADYKPDTLQVMLVKGLTKDQSEVSDNGQIIYASSETISDKTELQHLIFAALERRIAKDSGVSCPGIEAFLGSR